MHLRPVREPEFSAVTPLMAFITRVALCKIGNLNFSMYSEVFLKLRKFCRPCDDFGIKTLIRFG